MSPTASSTNLSSRSEIEPKIISTNTLIIANLSREAFRSENLIELRAQLEQYGTLYKFIPIKSFHRILAVYYNTVDASAAKTFADKMMFLSSNIRIYFGMHTPICDTIDKSQHLAVPKIEKNWLISPPRSPPVDWTQTREDSPNSNTLADDLIHALRPYATKNIGDIIIDEEEDEIPRFFLDDVSEKGKKSSLSRLDVPCLTIITNNEGDSDGGDDDRSVPMILVQDWDHDSTIKIGSSNLLNVTNVNHRIAQLPPLTYIPTPRPPIFDGM
ncbi:1772_t:CDS:2 [Ambispora gerdemannii]|uniref:1772_t:CDS:1 n=1 Tax=Ambispora gerdemannii TaxID=144530 RepID=A0A9N8V2K5_9GLOM|nr:1772_t:CDS:2 [Ambispora gerdemannii]